MEYLNLISEISVNAGVEILYKIYQRLDLLGNSMRGDNLVEGYPI
jgi:hypothetical protein